VPVAVQTGDKVSNFATIAVANGGACTDPNGFTGSTISGLTGSTAKIGALSLIRTSAKITAQGMTITSNTDTGSGVFQQYDVTQLQASNAAFANITAVGSCYVINSKSTSGQTPTVPLSTGLNAGTFINVKGPNGAKQMMPSNNIVGYYSGTFGTSQVIPNLPPGITIPGQTPPYLEAGAYTVDNGAGGPDVGGFTASLTLKTPLTWVNQDAITQVNRSQGVSVTWSGGDPAGTVYIAGSSSAKVGNDTYTGTFYCTAPVSAGQFTVPNIVTLSLPASSTTGAGAAAVPGGALFVGTTVTSSFTAPGINLGTITSSVLALKNLAYI
jgi:hypothetical protein